MRRIICSVVSTGATTTGTSTAVVASGGIVFSLQLAFRLTVKHINRRRRRPRFLLLVAVLRLSPFDAHEFPKPLTQATGRIITRICDLASWPPPLRAAGGP